MLMNPLLLKAAPWAIAIAVGGGWFMSHNAKQRALGAAAVRDSIKEARIDSLLASRNRVDTLYARDTVEKWRTVRTTETLFDTLLRSDTIVLTRRESVIVFAADSAIQACRSIVTGCESRLAVRDSLISSLTTDRNLWKHRASPSLRSQVWTQAKTVGTWELLKALARGARK